MADPELREENGRQHALRVWSMNGATIPVEVPLPREMPGNGGDSGQSGSGP